MSRWRTGSLASLASCIAAVLLAVVTLDRHHPVLIAEWLFRAGYSALLGLAIFSATRRPTGLRPGLADIVLGGTLLLLAILVLAFACP